MHPLFWAATGAAAAHLGKELIEDIDLEDMMNDHIDRLGRRMDNYFEQVESMLFGTTKNPPKTEWTRYHVRKGEGTATIYIEVPGLVADDISLDLKDAILTVSAEKETLPGHLLKFEHRFRVHAKLDISDFKATVKDGLLAITMKRDDVPEAPRGKVPVSNG